MANIQAIHEQKGAIVYSYSDAGWTGPEAKVMRTGALGEEDYAGTSGWGVGEVVTIVLDCDKWRMVFWKHETLLAAIDVEKDKTYYPTLGCCPCSDQSDFKLVSS